MEAMRLWKRLVEKYEASCNDLRSFAMFPWWETRTMKVKECARSTILSTASKCISTTVWTPLNTSVHIRLSLQNGF